MGKAGEDEREQIQRIIYSLEGWIPRSHSLLQVCTNLHAVGSGIYDLGRRRAKLVLEQGNQDLRLENMLNVIMSSLR